jgi:16S rRNA (uracil1498-N3)-methyltransferase
VALKAARQSRSPFITEVLPYRPFNEALDIVKGADLKTALWERPGIARIRDVLKEARQRGTRTVAVIAGPEGGFTDAEMEEASGLGFVPVSLGERILRTETAAIAAVAIIRYELTE